MKSDLTKSAKNANMWIHWNTCNGFRKVTAFLQSKSRSAKHVEQLDTDWSEYGMILKVKEENKHKSMQIQSIIYRCCQCTAGWTQRLDPSPNNTETKAARPSKIIGTLLGYCWHTIGIDWDASCEVWQASVAPNTPRLYDYRSPMTPRHFLASSKCSPELPRLKSQRPTESCSVCVWVFVWQHAPFLGKATPPCKDVLEMLVSDNLQGHCWSPGEFSGKFIGKTQPKSKQVCWKTPENWIQSFFKQKFEQSQAPQPIGP